MGILTDSYKASHYLQYPACREMVAVCTRCGLSCTLSGNDNAIINYVYCVASIGFDGSQYGEFRCGFNRDTEDTRMVVYGIRYLLETYLLRQWTVRDVEMAAKFYRSVLAAISGAQWTLLPLRGTTTWKGNAQKSQDVL